MESLTQAEKLEKKKLMQAEKLEKQRNAVINFLTEGAYLALDRRDPEMLTSFLKNVFQELPAEHKEEFKDILERAQQLEKAIYEGFEIFGTMNPGLHDKSAWIRWNAKTKKISLSASLTQYYEECEKHNR